MSGKTVYLHREILSLGAWSSNYNEVDHKNRNKLDCRKSNLVVGSHSDNQLNRSAPKNNTSGHKGVHWAKGKWVVQHKGEYLGRFTEIEDAIATKVAACS